jgi:PAB1-binding protein PBP1
MACPADKAQRTDAQIRGDQRRIREREARVMELERGARDIKKSTAFVVKEMDYISE